MENKLESGDKLIARKEFLIKLQLEYLTHKLRSQIYRDERYAKVASDIADKKKLKIQEVSVKFGLKSIFNGLSVNKFVKKYFLKPTGVPFFQYKDNEQRRVQSNYDMWYLLYRGTKVFYKGQLAEVVLNNPLKEEVMIRISEREFFVKYIQISLINKFNWL